jgi:hypothetical protein
LQFKILDLHSTMTGQVSANRTLILVTLAFSFLLQDVVKAETKEKLTGDLRIVGGSVANEYPSYGFSAGSSLCGGTLIHPEYVMRNN